MLSVKKADPDLIERTKRNNGRQFYPFDRMEIGDTFFVSFDDYIRRNGAKKYNGTPREITDMRAAIWSAARKYQPMKFGFSRRYHENTPLFLGYDVVRVA